MRYPYGGRLVHSTFDIQDREFSRQQNVRPQSAIRPVVMSNCVQLTPGTFSPDKLDANAEKMIDQGLKSFYKDASAETKMDLSPLLDQMQKNLQP